MISVVAVGREARRAARLSRPQPTTRREVVPRSRRTSGACPDCSRRHGCPRRCYGRSTGRPRRAGYRRSLPARRCRGCRLRRSPGRACSSRSRGVRRAAGDRTSRLRRPVSAGTARGPMSPDPGCPSSVLACFRLTPQIGTDDNANSAAHGRHLCTARRRRSRGGRRPAPAHGGGVRAPSSSPIAANRRRFPQTRSSRSRGRSTSAPR